MIPSRGVKCLQMIPSRGVRYPEPRGCRPSSRSTGARPGSPLPTAPRLCPPPSTRAGPEEAVWLPNEAVAKAWMEYVKTGRGGRHHAAAGAVQRVGLGQGSKREKRERKSNGEPMRTWRAALDVFIVLRDGKENGAGAAVAGRQVRPALIPVHDLPRHAGSAAARDAPTSDTSTQTGDKHA